MTDKLQERISVKMFIGCLFTSDLQYKLNQSHAWKEWLLTQDNTSFPFLEEVRFKNKTYLGTFCREVNITLPEVDEFHHFIQNKIDECCSSAAVDSIKVYIFPQVFFS